MANLGVVRIQSLIFSTSLVLTLLSFTMLYLPVLSFTYIYLSLLNYLFLALIIFVKAEQGLLCGGSGTQEGSVRLVVKFHECVSAMLTMRCL